MKEREKPAKFGKQGRGQTLCDFALIFMRLPSISKEEPPAPHTKNKDDRKPKDIIICSPKALRPMQEHQRQHWQS